MGTAYEPSLEHFEAGFRTRKEKTMKTGSRSVCSLCGGRMNPGTTTFTADLGSGVVVVRDVPAAICSQCGADWIGDDVASRLEQVVDDARRENRQFEVTTLA